MSSGSILVVPRLPDLDRAREAYPTGNGWMEALEANGLDATLAPVPTGFDAHRLHENVAAAQEHIREVFRPGVRAVLLPAADPEHGFLSMQLIGGLANNFAAHAYRLGIPRWVPTDRLANSLIFGIGDAHRKDLDGTDFPPKDKFYQCIGKGRVALTYMVEYMARNNS